MDPSKAKTRGRGSLAAGMTVAFLMAGPVSAQWATLRLPGTPRTADGTPSLTAPAPRTPDGKPDLSGIWRKSREGTKVNPQNIAACPADNGKGVPSERCLPHQI